MWSRENWMLRWTNVISLLFIFGLIVKVKTEPAEDPHSVSYPFLNFLFPDQDVGRRSWKGTSLGSEFLGKRSTTTGDAWNRMGYGWMFRDLDIPNKRVTGSEFLGKRISGSEFLGKRIPGSEFLGKRGIMSLSNNKRVKEENVEEELQSDRNKHYHLGFPVH